MRWPRWLTWWRRHPNGGHVESDLSQAKREAEDRLLAADRDTVEVRRVSGVLNRAARINHLGPLIAEALRAPREGRG